MNFLPVLGRTGRPGRSGPPRSTPGSGTPHPGQALDLIGSHSRGSSSPPRPLPAPPSRRHARQRSRPAVTWCPGVGTAGRFARLLGAGRLVGSTDSAAKAGPRVPKVGYDAGFDHHDGPAAGLLGKAAPHASTYSSTTSVDPDWPPRWEHCASSAAWAASAPSVSTARRRRNRGRLPGSAARAEHRQDHRARPRQPRSPKRREPADECSEPAWPTPCDRPLSPRPRLRAWTGPYSCTGRRHDHLAPRLGRGAH